MNKPMAASDRTISRPAVPKLGSTGRQIRGLTELLAGDAPLALNTRGKAGAALNNSLVKVG